MKPFIEVLLDEPPILRITRVANWIHCYDYETGLGEWYHHSEREALEEHRGVSQEDLRKSA